MDWPAQCTNKKPSVHKVIFTHLTYLYKNDAQSFVFCGSSVLMTRQIKSHFVLDLSQNYELTLRH